MNENEQPKPTPSLVVAALHEIAACQTTPKGFRNCCACCARVELAPDSPRWRELDIKCPACIEKERALAEEQAKAAQESRLSGVPAAFRRTMREKLPHPDKLDMALRWQFGPEGLLLYGPTGCGKSRVAWEIGKRELAAGRDFRCVDGFELSKYPALCMSDSESARKFAESLAHAQILMLDDVFKAKATERVEELLFGVIDERGQWERPCIITVNDTGETLVGRLSADRGPALIRRLREYCQTIQF